MDLQARFNDAAPQSLTEDEHPGQSADYLAAEAKCATMKPSEVGERATELGGDFVSASNGVSLQDFEPHRLRPVRPLHRRRRHRTTQSNRYLAWCACGCPVYLVAFHSRRAISMHAEDETISEQFMRQNELVCSNDFTKASKALQDRFYGSTPAAC